MFGQPNAPQKGVKFTAIEKQGKIPELNWIRFLSSFLAKKP